MATTSSPPQRRTWSDALAILAGVTSVGLGIWGVSFRTEDAGGGTPDVAALSIRFFLAGLLAVLAVVVAQKRQSVGRAMLGVAGLILLSGVFALGGATPMTLATILIPGIAMLVATPFIGPMPAPAD